jgi:hypothetical protein
LPRSRQTACYRIRVRPDGADFTGSADFAGIAPGKFHARQFGRPGKRCGKTAPKLRFAGAFQELGQDAPPMAQVLQSCD